VIPLKKSIILLVLVFAAACSGKSDPAAAPASPNGEKTKQMIEEFSSAKRTAKSVSAKTSELVVAENDGSQTTYPMPKDEFYLSIAPFVEHTHNCYNHNLATCKGELANKTVHVNVKDASGKVLVDKEVQTYQNGFLDLWVPRGEKVKVKVDYEGKSSEELLTTNENDRTCITTMKLS
jgi:hypothetical protein